MDSEQTADCQVKIRLPADLRDWLKHQAIANRRTLMREIEHRLLEDRRLAEQPAGAAQ